MRKWASKTPKPKKMWKSSAPSASTVIFEIADFSKSSLKATKLSTFSHFLLFKILFSLLVIVHVLTYILENDVCAKPN